jgi:hypothetical protein
MRVTVFLCAFLALGALSARAKTTIDNPEVFVRGVYDRIAKTKDYREPDDIYTDRLKSLFALDSKEAGGEVGRIDFDFWINAQDSEITGVHVSSSPVESAPMRRTVVAKFKNIGRPEEIHFYFERDAHGWRLDDARSAGAEAWTLSLILKYGFEEK